MRKKHAQRSSTPSEVLQSSKRRHWPAGLPVDASGSGSGHVGIHHCRRVCMHACMRAAQFLRLSTASTDTAPWPHPPCFATAVCSRCHAPQVCSSAWHAWLAAGRAEDVDDLLAHDLLLLRQRAGSSRRSAWHIAAAKGDDEVGQGEDGGGLRAAPPIRKWMTDESSGMNMHGGSCLTHAELHACMHACARR